jgi:hypothetical protein
MGPEAAILSANKLIANQTRDRFWWKADRQLLRDFADKQALVRFRMTQGLLRVSSCAANGQFHQQLPSRDRPTIHQVRLVAQRRVARRPMTKTGLDDIGGQFGVPAALF